MARKSKSQPAAQAATTEEQLKRLEQLFEQLTHFTKLVSDNDDAIIEAKFEVEEAQAKLDDAKQNLRALEGMRDGAKHNLYRFLSPKNGAFEFLPLFDKMAETDEVVHGRGSTQWRQEPVAALKLSLPALQILNDADIILVGQLQDRVMKSASDWWKDLQLTGGQAAAIVDRLNDFIFEHTK
ncbi:MAG: hypothetical protein ABL921_18975 [Pirellula sp.]